jgi:mannose-6-phosphate isomerase
MVVQTQNLRKANEAELAFVNASQKLSAWCKDALSYWDKQARDPMGGFAEHLDLRGRPDFNHLRRVRVQFRQAYVYAHAAHLGWYAGAGPAADHAWNFGLKPGCDGGDFIVGTESAENGMQGCAHLVTGQGKLWDETRDLYAQAFLLLASAWRFRAFKDDEALRLASGTIDFLNTHLKAENGGWYEALPLPDNPTRRQNPHMHLFEAFLALYEATWDSKFLLEAQSIFGLFRQYFFDAKQRVLLEHFNSDWTAFDGGGPVEPGHMMEWVWLLYQYSRLSGQDTRNYRDALYESAMELGWNADLGLLSDVVDLRGSVALTSRTWPQTEWLKAAITRAATQKRPASYQAATQAIDALFEHYLDDAPWGGWFDKLSADGKILSDTMPTSTFYHLFCAAAEADALRITLTAHHNRGINPTDELTSPLYPPMPPRE